MKLILLSPFTLLITATYYVVLGHKAKISRKWSQSDLSINLKW